MENDLNSENKCKDGKRASESERKVESSQPKSPYKVPISLLIHSQFS